MNSTMTTNSVHRGKLLIHVAENGHSFEIDCDESTLVEAIQQFMESMAAIPLKHQLLLYADMKLESQDPLSAYKLPSDQEEVFCFNKAKLQANAQPPSSEHLEIIDMPEPPKPLCSSSPHPLENAPDPALDAFPSYERQFRHHYHCGHVIYNRTLLKFENCQKLLREQKVQARAMEIAGRNLEHFFRILYQNYLDFFKCYTQQHRMHSDLLMNFARDIEKLRVCKLIPALQTSSRRCLIDLVKEEDLRKLSEHCGNSHSQFEIKVSQFKHVFGKLKQDVDDLFSSKACFPIKNTELMIREQQQTINEQKSIIQSLSKDISTVKKLVDDCVTSQLSSSIRPHDAVSALGPMYEVHEKDHLPRMRDCDRSISDFLSLCLSKKNEMSNFTHSYLQKVAYIQHNIKDVRLQFNAFSEALKRQDGQFEGLRLVRVLGPAYRACLAEVVRRKASMKLHIGMAGQLAEKLAEKREVEVKRREDFLKAHLEYIPRDIIASMGLLESPSQCDVSIAPFDTSLLDIDIVDIERFAPKRLFGLTMKNDKQSSSSGSAHSLESEELTESCEFIEIVGTSRMEVENAKLKAELASAIATICSFSPDFGYSYTDDGELDSFMKNAAEKTAEALQLKDEYAKYLLSGLKEKQMESESYKKRIQELEQNLFDQYTKGKKFSGGHKDDIVAASEMLIPHLDSAMVEPQCEDEQKDDIVSDSTNKLSNALLPAVQTNVMLEGEENEKLLDESKSRLKSAVEEVERLGRELEISRNLLDESQLNCAHLENCLHEAREEAQTHLCSANRKASEYSTLRESAVKTRGFLMRLKSSVTVSGGVPAFSDSLHSLAQSLSKLVDEQEDNVTVDFQVCVKVLSDRVGILCRQRGELLERCSKAESSNKLLLKELDESKEVVKTLYTKHQVEKQANKEKISFCRFEVHEIAAFVLKETGHYEAINRDCCNYYLSPESVSLFSNHLPNQPTYIVGQIVHIERQTVKPPPMRGEAVDLVVANPTSNPYGLPVGCGYFVVTIAMLPDASVHSPATQVEEI